MKIEVDRFRKNWPAIQKKTTDQRTWNLYMEGQCEEMLERPMLWTVLKTPAEQGDWDLAVHLFSSATHDAWVASSLRSWQYYCVREEAFKQFVDTIIQERMQGAFSEMKAGKEPEQNHKKNAPVCFIAG